MSSPLLGVGHRTLKRLPSYYNSDCEHKEDPRFGRLLSAVEKNELLLLRKVFEEDHLPVGYQEPAHGNRTSLHYAAKFNFKEGVRHLLKNGADCNAVDDNGQTALHMAAGEGFVEICKDLLTVGASLSCQDKKGRTALHWAVTSVSDTNTNTEQNIAQIVQMMLQKGACPTTRDKDERTPLHLAAQAGVTAAVTLLLSGRGSASVTTRDNDMRTPLHYAVQGAKSLETVSVLLDKNAYIDAVDAKGQTALHVLTGRKIAHVDEEFDIMCLEILLSRGASVDIVDKDEANPLSLTLFRTMWWGRGSSRDFLFTIVQMLVAKGSNIVCCCSMWRMIQSFPTLLYYTLNNSLRTNTSVDNSVYLILDFDMRSLIATEKLTKFAKAHATQNSILSEDTDLPPALATSTDVSILHYLIVTGNRRVLSHPICRSFLHFKWLKVRKYFFFNFILNWLFVLSLTSYVFLITDCTNHIPKSLNTTKTSAVDNKTLSFNNATPVQELDNTWESCLEEVFLNRDDKLIAWIVLLVVEIVVFIRELVQFGINPLLHFFSLKRTLSFLLLSVIPLLLVRPCACDAIWWTQVGATAVIGSWISLLLSFGQFPAFGVYIVMFSTVATNVLKFLGLYMLLLIAFAFGFHVLLRPYKTFSSVFLSLSTTFVMMTGELDYESIFVDVGREQVGLLCIIFLLLFIFLVYIILSNLLVGLAVSDMTAIRKRSELMRLTTQVELMVQFESIIRSRILPVKIQNFLIRSICLNTLGQKPVISIYPNKKKGWVTKTYRIMSKVIGPKLLNKIFESYIDGFIPPDTEPELPSRLLKTSLNIALKQFEIEKRDRLLRHAPVSNRVSTVINRMPMPMPARRMRHVTKESEAASASFSDIIEEDSDNSDGMEHLVQFASERESHPLFGKSKHLTLRKSSRRNLFDRRTSMISLQNMFGYVNNPMDQDDIRQTLLELQMTLDNLEESLVPATPLTSRRASTKSRKIVMNEVNV